MRTALFLASGFLLLAACAIWARLFGENYPWIGNCLTGAFLLAWLGITGFNMWTGVHKAGYATAEELPIFLLLFAVPAATALLVRWKLL